MFCFNLFSAPNPKTKDLKVQATEKQSKKADNFCIFMPPKYLQCGGSIAIHLCACVCACVCYRLYSELKKSTCEKPKVQFQWNLAGLCLGWRVSKDAQRMKFSAVITYSFIVKMYVIIHKHLRKLELSSIETIPMYRWYFTVDQ